jgi:hypothetical protein
VAAESRNRHSQIEGLFILASGIGGAESMVNIPRHLDFTPGGLKTRKKSQEAHREVVIYLWPGRSMNHARSRFK